MTEERGPDERGPAVIVSGCVLGGFDFRGPFDTIDAAHTYLKDTLAGKLEATVGECTIVLLTPPKYAGETAQL